MTDTFRIVTFEPLNLYASDVGPFQQRTEEVCFISDERNVSNLFLLLSANGKGKTTLLNAFAALMSILAGPSDNPELEQARIWLKDFPRARMQLDVRVTYTRGAEEGSFVLSLFLGDMDDAALRSYDTDDELGLLGCASWHRLGLTLGRRRTEGIASLSHPENKDYLLAELLTLILISGESPPRSELENPDLAVPTLLYFTADRQVVRPLSLEPARIKRPDDWNYRVVRRFDMDGQRWGDSIDNLLVWLYWLDDGKGRFEQARKIINQRVFRGTQKKLHGIQKDPQQALVLNAGSQHRIDQLSSGEKTLLQLFIRIAAHMTRNTILVIDEVDLHLHPKWERRTVDTLKGLICDLEEKDEPIHLMAILSAQSREVLERFDIHTSEMPLRKGGAIIADEFEALDEVRIPEDSDQ